MKEIVVSLNRSSSSSFRDAIEAGVHRCSGTVSGRCPLRPRRWRRVLPSTGVTRPRRYYDAIRLLLRRLPLSALRLVGHTPPCRCQHGRELRRSQRLPYHRCVKRERIFDPGCLWMTCHDAIYSVAFSVCDRFGAFPSVTIFRGSISFTAEPPAQAIRPRFLSVYASTTSSPTALQDSIRAAWLRLGSAGSAPAG